MEGQHSALTSHVCICKDILTPPCRSYDRVMVNWQLAIHITTVSLYGARIRTTVEPVLQVNVFNGNNFVKCAAIIDAD